jgi:hypothetical protein
MSAHGEEKRFIHQQRHTRCLGAPDELLGILDEIMISLAHEHTRSCSHRFHQIERVRKVVQRIVDEVAGEKNQIRLQIVRRPHDIVEDTAFGESSDVQVAHLRDRQAVKRRRKLWDRNEETADAKTLQLRQRKSSGP